MIMGDHDSWTRWEAKIDFQRRVQASIEKHRVSRNVTTEEYLTVKRAEFTRELEGKIFIYLDTKHWVNLCNVVVRSKKSLPIYGEILAHLKHLTQNVVCCPVSSPLFEELMKQNDIETRQATARMMDSFSGGVCLKNWLTLAQVEFANHVCRTFEIEETKRPNLSPWTKIGCWIDEHTFNFPELAGEESTLIQKLYIDLTWEMSLEHYQAMPGRVLTPDAFAIAWVKADEYSQACQANAKLNFSDLVRQRRRQLLSTLMNDLLPMLSLCRGKAGTPDDHVFAALDPIYEGRDHKAVPSLEVMAGLDAAITQESKRKVQANDMLDYLHAAQALPYCDALFCDNFMSQKMRFKPLEFGKIYDTEIGSRPEEILLFLSKLT